MVCTALLTNGGEMRISRWCYLAVAAALTAVVVAPATASALLTNEWNQKFAGTAVCVNCHGSAYDNTSHGHFVNTGANLEPSPDSGMWPAGQKSAGMSIDATNTFSLGAGTGGREYITWDATQNFFMVPALAWDPANPSLWEIDGTAGITADSATYGCGQCHQLGWVTAGKTVNGVTATKNSWAIPEGADPTNPASYIPGSSIQCEKCHGTGVAATNDQGGHWSAGVKIVGYSTASNPLAKAASTKLLDSQVCGQCHASFKNGTSSAGFTPDATLTDFVTMYTASDVPASFSASSKFFPNGQNKSLHHSYYTEWAMSAHSWRGALTSSSPNATPYQKLGKGHFSSNTSILCNRCHTGEGYLKRKLDASAPLGNIMSTVPETTSNQGQYGTECVDCHIAHGAQTSGNAAVGMSVRAPEKANGAYSTKGLSVDNQSICEDCHNWQKEVDGSALTLPTILTGKYVSHPQREIYHGRAMLEIPAGSDFMPGAKCEQCHMPATYSDNGASTSVSRYADRSVKRYSHRMFIMMPGDAKAWGLGAWGDSCSPCHTGETQDQLQANIDTWQSTAAGLAKDATAAISAAVSAGHGTAAGDVDLLKRATANVSLFVQDSSGGVHNPKYEQAGLTKAIQLAKSAGGTLSIMAPKSVGYDQMFGVMGVALNGDGTAAAGVTVTLFANGTPAGTAVTDANGNYGFSFAETATNAYTVKWARSSQAVSDLTAGATVKIQKAYTSLSLTRSASSVKVGAKFTLKGVFAPDLFAPTTITVQYKKPGSSTWATLRALTTTDTGAYSTTYSTKAKGTWQFRAIFAGSAGAYSSTSSTVKVLVK